MSDECDHKTGPSTTTTEGSAEVTRCVCGYVLLVSEDDDDD